MMTKKVLGIFVLLLCSVATFAQVGADPLQVFFRVGSAKLASDAISPSVVDSVKSVCASGQKYTVLGVASPEGSTALNQRLAQRRAQAIASRLVKLTGLPDSMFVLQTKICDMDNLRELVMQDENLPCRQQVLDVLSEGQPSQVALSKLKRLEGGTPYLYIKDRLFPYMRASVASDKQIDFHPDLASSQQPRIIQRDYAKRTIISDHSGTASSAVAQSKGLRHSPSNEKAVSSEKVKKDSAEAVVGDTASSDVQKEMPVSLGEKIVEKKKSYNWLPWGLVLCLLLVMAGLVTYYRSRIRDLNRQLSDADYQLNVYKHQAEVKQPEVKSNVDMYADGEVLYHHLQNGGAANQWTNDQIRTLIDYYRVINQPLIHSLETDYDGLTPNHFLFEILMDMGKTDAEIQQILNISQTTIRSNRFRIKSKKR